MATGPGDALERAHAREATLLPQPRETTAPPPSRETRVVARSLALAGLLLLLVAWSSGIGIPSDAVQIFGWLWLGTIAWNIEAHPREHLRFGRDWWVPMVLLVAYFYSRGLADELVPIPVSFQMPVTVDRWLFLGHLPTVELQQALCGHPCDPQSPARWFDRTFTWVYSTHFFLGLVLAVVLWMRNRVEWKRWMRRYVGINLSGLVVYVLYPMAPPWLAADEGYIHEELHRLTSRGWDGTGLGRFHLVLTGVGNPVAAMPSLHAGVAFLLAIYGIQRLRSAWRWALLAYPLVMSFALVYYGEHYVIDILAGAALAGVVVAGCSWSERIRGD